MIADAGDDWLRMCSASPFESYYLTTDNVISAMSTNVKTVCFREICFANVCIKDVSKIKTNVCEVILMHCEDHLIIFQILEKYQNLQILAIMSNVEYARHIVCEMEHNLNFRFSLFFRYEKKRVPFAMELSGNDDIRDDSSDFNKLNEQLKILHQRNINAYMKCHDAAFLVCKLAKHTRLFSGKDVGYLIARYVWNTKGTQIWT
jgi:hypothetical protein